MIYDIKKGYGLQLTKFDESNTDSIIYKSTKREIIELADRIIRTFKDKGLMEELNEMQANSIYYDKDDRVRKSGIFRDKYEIPAYFINLLLSKYCMKVRGWENDIPQIGEED